MYKVVQIWPGQSMICLHTNRPGHIWTTLYIERNTDARSHNHSCCGKGNYYYVFWMCVCSLIYPACQAHAPYYIVICGLSDCIVFFHVMSDNTIFGKWKLLNIKLVFWVSVRGLSKIFFILRRIQRASTINVHWSPCKVPVIRIVF
jgi:hypothetical protein